ncbi:MAG TPA: tetratricopeptide repeat protein [Puia sp.]|nr:tetratricopeptide repeat protein [Puia sp.]
MKKKYGYAVLLVAFAAIAAIVLWGYKMRENKIDNLLERNASSGSAAERALIRDYASSLRNKIEKNPEDIKSILALTTLFIQEARVTGNYVYYDKAALKCVNRVLKIDSLNFEALSFKSLIYLSQHHFADGLALAEKAQKLNPFNAFIYGLLVDGNVEMGHYDSAVTNADRMESVRPDIRSYSRISYLREIHGDYPGAIEAMQMAVNAGGQGDETTEWTRIQLGRLYENTGDLKSAKMHYTIALNERPDYPFALAGLARIAVADKDYAAAIGLYRKADSLINDFSIREEWADVYRLTGQKERADSLMDIVIAKLNEDEQSGQQDENIGHYADRELAFAYLKVNRYDQALEHALLEYNRRPDNIDVNETVAWVYYCRKQYAEALPFLRTALRTHCENPVLLYRAGLILAKAGKQYEAKTILKKAISTDSNIAMVLKKEGFETWQSLQ